VNKPQENFAALSPFDSDDLEIEDGDIITPPIFNSVTYQSFCDELNVRPCFDTPIAHQEGDILIIHLIGDVYRYRYSNNQWHPDCVDMNEPLRVLNESGIAEGVDHIKPYNNDNNDEVFGA
jgi:hypothetical protein